MAVPGTSCMQERESLLHGSCLDGHVFSEMYSVGLVLGQRGHDYRECQSIFRQQVVLGGHNGRMTTMYVKDHASL